MIHNNSPMFLATHDYINLYSIKCNFLSIHNKQATFCPVIKEVELTLFHRFISRKADTKIQKLHELNSIILLRRITKSKCLVIESK